MIMKLNDIKKEFINNKLNALSKSKFRIRFRLNDKERRMIENYGIDKIRSHAKDFVLKKLEIQNDSVGNT